jgi:CHAD domain-containing protein
MRLEPRELSRPAAQGARILVTALLREAEAELPRLEKGGDEEALHDFRVALRRLRSALRALRPCLPPSIQRKEERRLRAVARATAPARDAEVQLAWLRHERTAARPRELPGIEWLELKLDARRQEAYQRAARVAPSRFRKVARRLATKLARGRREPVAKAEARSLGAALAELVRVSASDLSEALDAIGGPFEVEQGHAARIAAKRLRYLLEPLRGGSAVDAGPAVAILKELQELLGELHDAHVASELVAAALTGAAVERARQAHAAIMAGDLGGKALRLVGRGPIDRGLLALDRRAADRARAAHAGLAQEWMPARRGALVEALATIAGALAPRPAGLPPAPRRFLLAELPGGLSGKPALHDETGWLAGPSPRTWLRQVHGPGGTQWFRGDDAGPPAGAPVSEGTFVALWPATEDWRLEKTRHLLVDQGRSWSVDAVVGLRLVLAEVVAPGGDDLRVPRSLRPLLVREVTDEKAYRDLALCSRRRRALQPARSGGSAEEGRGGEPSISENLPRDP